MSSPYPFEHLRKLTRAQAHAITEVHSRISDAGSEGLAAALACARTLLGTSLSCELGVPEPTSGIARAHASRSVWVELEPAGAGPEHCIWLELPIGLCEHLVDRVLGGESRLDAPATSLLLDELSLGVLGYFVARVCAALDAHFTLRSIGTDAPLLQPASIRLAATLQNGEARATLQLYAPAPRFGARSGRRARRRLDALPLALWADAGSARLHLTTLRSLATGDVIVLDRTSLTRTAEGEWRGEATLRVSDSACALVCRAWGRRLEVERIPCTSGPSMTSGRSQHESTDATQPRIARDAPIELALEIARFQLTLGELERVRPGDVLTTGRRIGEVVTLRAAGRAIAEGELVDVEGELGVRITRLFTF